MTRGHVSAGYTTREVAQTLGIPPHRVRAMARQDYLEPGRVGRALRFSFPDVIVLRTALELQQAGVSARRIHRTLRELREQLPRGRPLSAVRIVAEGDEVLVQDRDTVWAPETGQVAFDFAVEELASKVEPFAARASRERQAAAGEMGADDWYDLGHDLEAVSLREASNAYRRALELSPGHPEAHLNLGRIVHEQGDLSEAERNYRAALAQSPRNAMARFNLGVVLEDQGRTPDAVAEYRAALEEEPSLAPAHFNLSRLLEASGDVPGALQHLAAYKRLRDRGRA